MIGRPLNEIRRGHGEDGGEAGTGQPKRPLRGCAGAVVFVFVTSVALMAAEGAVRLLDLWPSERRAAVGGRSAEAEAATGEANEPQAGEQRPDDPTQKPFSRWIVHPFRGITPRPLFDNGEGRTSVLGHLSRVADPRQLAEDDFVVGVFGGSVARSTALVGGPTLETAIASRLPKGSPRVRVVNFAISGYKQPQQLFLLQELLLLGAPLDFVINLDGYNELVLGTLDASSGYHPLYPQHDFWIAAFGASAGSLSERQVELAARTLRLRRQAEGLPVSRARLPVLRRSALFRAIMGMRIQRIEALALAAEEEMRQLPTQVAARDLFALDDPCLHGTDGCLNLVLEVWLRSSELMQRVASLRGAGYLHALQPNQYVAGSKILSQRELDKAWNPGWGWSRAAASGYSSLRSAGARLKERGIWFEDLTQIFAGHRETIYQDTCCHYNALGSEIVALELGRLVGDRVAGRVGQRED